MSDEIGSDISQDGVQDAASVSEVLSDGASRFVIASEF